MNPTREELLVRIKNIIDRSAYMGSAFLKAAEKYNEEQLEKLELIVQAIFKTEKQLAPEDKEKLDGALEKYSTGVINIAQKTQRTFREETERKSQASDADLEKMLAEI